MADQVAPQLKTLSDIFRTKSDPFDIDDDDGSTVSVVMVKPNIKTSDSIERRAAAARARLRLEFDDPLSDASMALADDIESASNADMVAAIIAVGMREVELSTYFSHRMKDEWNDDDKLSSLEMAYYLPGPNGELSLEFVAASPNDGTKLLDPDEEAEWELRYDEAIRVRDELARFHQAVRDEVEAERTGMLDSYSAYERENLIPLARDAYIKGQCDMRFAEAQETQRIFFCTRHADSLRKPYFGTALEVEDLDDEVRARLVAAYLALETPLLEGKGLPGSLGSSEQSEASPEEEASTASGPQDATPSRTSPPSS